MILYSQAGLVTGGMFSNFIPPALNWRTCPAGTNAFAFFESQSPKAIAPGAFLSNDFARLTGGAILNGYQEINSVEIKF
jgi:hypothetical protein